MNSALFKQLCERKLHPEARTFVTQCGSEGERKGNKEHCIQLLWWVLIPLWPFLISPPFTATVLFHCTPFTSLSPLSLSFLSQLSFCVSCSISPLTPPPSRHCASHSSPPPKRKWENGKSCCLLWHPCLPTNNAVLRFVQLPRSLLVCMYPSNPPPHTHTHSTPFPYRPTKAADAVFSAAKPPATLLHHQQPPDCYSSKYAEGSLPKATYRERERDACQCCLPTTTNSRLGSAVSWEGFQQDTFFYLDGWWWGLRWGWRRRRNNTKRNIICIYSSLKKSLESCGCHRWVLHWYLANAGWIIEVWGFSKGTRIGGKL